MSETPSDTTRWETELRCVDRTPTFVQDDEKDGDEFMSLEGDDGREGRDDLEANYDTRNQQTEVDFDDDCNSAAARTVDDDEGSIETETTDDSKSDMLRMLREDSLKTLTISPREADSTFYADIAHALRSNGSVEEIHFTTFGRRCSLLLTATDLIILLTAFQDPRLRERVSSLIIDATTLPLFIGPTLLWQFRNLRQLTLCITSDCLTWRRMAKAVSHHPRLQSVELFRPSNSELPLPKRHSLSGCVDDFVQELSTVSQLRAYIQKGTRSYLSTSSHSYDRQLQVRVSTLVHLFSGTKIETFRYNGFGFPKNSSEDDSSCSNRMDYVVPSCLSSLADVISASKLVTLSLAYNRIQGPAMQDLAIALCTMPTLLSLDLSGNPIGECNDDNDDAMCLISILASNPQLKLLSLSSCALHDPILAGLANVVADHTSLLSLGVAKNEFTELATLETFLFASQKNESLEHWSFDTTVCKEMNPIHEVWINQTVDLIANKLEGNIMRKCEDDSESSNLD